jgi:hypothetical protein
MIGFQRELVGRLVRAASSLALAGGALGCQQQPSVTPIAEPQQTPQVEQVGVVAQAGLAEDCGLVCDAKGIVEGNANISGVASVDAFFASVLNFQAKADGLSASINAELEGIKADFGIEGELQAGLEAEISANLEGGLTIEAEPAKCQVDAQASLEAQANCDVDVDPGSATIACKGSCEVEASADVQCDASAMLECTFTAPSAMCEGSCQGSCEVELTAQAACEGTCTGQCSGECSAYAKNAMGQAECSGTCNGMCMGSCKAELAAGASCSGKCEGECTVQEPEGGCEGAVRASCKAEANAMVMCSGSCEGEIEPPSAKAECQASAKAEAKLNVECTPPRVAISYELRAGVDAAAQARFVAAVKNLQVRLPALLAALKKAEGVAQAGVDLTAEAGGTLTGAIEAQVSGNANLQATVGLGCALTELPKVAEAITDSSGRLAASITASAELTGALDLS